MEDLRGEGQPAACLADAPAVAAVAELEPGERSHIVHRESTGSTCPREQYIQIGSNAPVGCILDTRFVVPPSPMRFRKIVSQMSVQGVIDNVCAPSSILSCIWICMVLLLSMHHKRGNRRRATEGAKMARY